MSLRTDAFHDVIDRFFEAAAVPERWPDALHALARACGAEGAAANSIDGRKTLASVGSRALAGLHDAFVTRWRAPELNSHRTRGLALIQRGWRGVLTEQDCFSPEELARDPFHQEFFLRNGFSSFAGVILAQAPGPMLSISINRRPAQGAYSRDEIAHINALASHLRGAAEVAVRLGMAASRRMADALGSAGQPVALIGCDGHVIHVNARFEQMIGDGVQVKAGRLGSWQADADRMLAAAIDRALRHDGAAREPPACVVLPRRAGLRPLIARVIPVVGEAHDVLHMAAAIVALTDLKAAALGPAEMILHQAFELTPAEARLAAQIAAGKTLQEISAADGSARETLRSRLKAVFDKTGTGRQAELALLLSRLADNAR